MVCARSLVFAAGVLGCGPRVPPAGPRAAAPTMQATEVPAADPSGPARQVRVLYDGPAVKVVSIRLRGVDLPPHHSEFTVSIQVLEGRGALVVGDRTAPLDATHGAVLAPRVAHEVTRQGDGDLVLLVTHAKGPVAP